MLGYFAARAIAGVERVDDGTYRRTVVVDGDPSVLELSYGGADHLVLRVRGRQERDLAAVVERARHVFNLDADMDGALRHLGGDPVIGALVRARPGVRAAGTWDPFETGVRAIIGQQVTVAGANTLIARVVERHGQAMAGHEELGLTHLFPDATVLADADLDGLGLVTSRAQAIRAFARAVADREVRLDRTAGLEELVASITSLPGLGPWTAHYIALRLGERDAFPASDLGLRRALDPSTPLSEKALAAMAEAWRPWRALAAAQLWMA